MTKFAKSSTVTNTIRSLTTGSVFDASAFALFSRSSTHVDDEVWDDGRIPAVSSEGYRPYSMTSFEPSDLDHGYQTYLFDEDGNCDEGSGAYEPVEFVVAVPSADQVSVDGRLLSLADAASEMGSAESKWAAGHSVELAWESGEGDARLLGWERDDGERVISTNGDPIWSAADDFDAYWDAESVTVTYYVADDQVREKLDAASDEEATSEARTWLETGDWDSAETHFLSARVIRVIGDTEETIETLRHVIQAEAPRCPEGEHDWEGLHEIVGGIAENPGVWGNGGGVTITEVCRHCGCAKKKNTWATDPSDGSQGHTVVTYDRESHLQAWESYYGSGSDD